MIQDISCEQCIDFLTRIAALFQTAEFANSAAGNLRGPVYCENTEYIPADQAATCQEFMDLVAIQAINALGSLMSVSTERICNEGCTPP